MTPERVRQLAVAVVLALAMVAVLVWSYDYSPAGRALPVLVAWATIGLLSLESLVQTGTWPGRVIDRIFSGTTSEDASTAEQLTGPSEIRGELLGMLWPLVLVAAIIMVGILPAVSAYVLLSLRFAGGKSLVQATLMAVGVTAFIWGVFEWGMSYQLFRGVVFGDFQGF